MKCEKSVPLQGEKVQKQQTANVNKTRQIRQMPIFLSKSSKTRQIRQMPILPSKSSKTRQIRLYLLMYLLMILLMILLMLYHLTVVYIKAPQPPLT